jgi:cell division protein FtsL
MAKGCMTKRTARKRTTKPRRGRWIIAALLIGFVVVASAVIWRRSYGITQASEIGRLDRHLVQLEAERGRLSALIRDESSQTRLGPIVQKLGMRLPDDAHVRTLKR